MEEERSDILTEEEQQPSYKPRPAWQVWAARAGVVIMILAFLLYCYQIATGGM